MSQGAGDGGSDGDFHLTDRLFGQGDYIAFQEPAVGGQGLFAGAADVDDVFRTPEPPGDCEVLPVVGDAGVRHQAVVVRPDAQNVLADGQEGPAGGACEPAVLGVARIALGPAGDGLGVDVGLGLVDLALVL